MLRLLQGMAAAEATDALNDAESVCDGVQCWRGDERTSRAMVNRLLKLTQKINRVRAYAHTKENHHAIAYDTRCRR